MRSKLRALVPIPALIALSVAVVLFFFIVPFYQVQSYDEQTACEYVDNILELDGKSYGEAKRFSTNPSGMIERYQITSLTDEQLSSINNCGFENLPSLVSSILEKRVGFFEGQNGHYANGKASLIEIESGNYLRFVDYEIKYNAKPGSSLIVPELHVYLRLFNNDGTYADKYLERLKEKVGAKNYSIDEDYLKRIHSVVIKNLVVHEGETGNYSDFETVAIVQLDEKPNWLTPISWLLKQSDSIPNPTSHSKMVDEKTGRFEGIGDIKAKGKISAEYEEDNADIVIGSFEITRGDDLNLYLTKDGMAKHPSGGWAFNPKTDVVYVSNTNNDEILQYRGSDGTFVDFFAAESSLQGPKDLLLSSDGRHLYVINTDNEVLRYDTSDGTFVVFSTFNSPIVDATLSSDGRHLYVINTDNEVLRYDTSDGTFVVFSTFNSPIVDATLSSDGRHLYVINTDNEVLRYDTSDGTFVDFFTFGGSLQGPKDLLLSSDGRHLYVSSYFTHEILRLDVETKQEIAPFVSPYDGKLDEPSSIRFGPDSKVWVSSTGTNELLQFDSGTGLFLSNTEFTESLGQTMDGPTGLALGPYCQEYSYSDDCTIFVADSGNSRILKYNPNEKKLEPFINNLNATSPSHIEFGPPTCSKKNGDCSLFVSFPDIHQIQRYDAVDGTFKDNFLNQRESKEPRSFTFDEDGILYVSSWKTDEILRYNQTGGFEDEQNPFATGGGLNGPGGLTFASINDELKLFVTSQETHSVLQFNGTGGNLLSLPDGTKEFIERDVSGMVQPGDITYHHDGFLYVVSQKTDEIFKYDIYGKFIEKFISDRSNGLINPNRLGLVNGDLCVSSAYTDSILCYDEQTRVFTKKLTTSFNQKLDTPKFSEIGGLDGELYVSLPLFNEVNRYESISGLFTDTLISGEKTLLQGPRYLTLYNGSIFVSSANNNEVIRYDGDTGEFIEIFVNPDSGGLDSPHGLAFDESTGDLYVSSNDNYRVLRYDSEGNFVDDFIRSRTGGLQEPRGLIHNNGSLYVSSFVGNDVLKFNTTTKEYDKYPVPGPEGLALSKNGILYVVSSTTNQIYAIDTTSNQPSAVALEKIEGPDFRNPKGITFVNDKLFVSNFNDDQVIKYNLKTKKTSFEPDLVARPTLIKPYGLFYDEEKSNLFIASVFLHRILQLNMDDDSDLDSRYDDKFSKKDLGLDNPLDLTFHPKTKDLFVISGANNDVWQYDASTAELLGSAISFEEESDPNLHGAELHGTFRNLVFSHDGSSLFISSPFNNKVYKYEVDSEGNFNYLKDFIPDSADDIPLSHPTEIILSSIPDTLFVVSHGSNQIHTMSTSDGTFHHFANATKNGMIGIEKLVMGHDENLYALGYDRTVHRYDGQEGYFRGEFDLGGISLGDLPENLLGTKFNINRVNTTDYDNLVVYDDYLEKPYALISLTDSETFVIGPLITMYNAIVAELPLFMFEQNIMKNLGHTNKAGYFAEDKIEGVTAIGQADVHIAEDVAVINIHGFEIQYDPQTYVDYGSAQGITDGPKLHVCLAPNDSTECGENKPNQGYLGRMNVNVGDEIFITDSRYLTDKNYTYLVVTDTGLDHASLGQSSTMTYIELHDYWVSRISPELLMSWIQNEFISIAGYTVTLLIIPLFFDYIRTAGKILILSGYGMFKRFRKKEIMSKLNLNKKLTIMIPAYNEESGIEESIKAAVGNSYPNKEVIVIDDASKDNTFKIAKKYADKGLIRLLHRETGSGSKAAALNYGAKFATGDLILCMDGDTILDKNAVLNAIHKFNDDEVSAISGNVKIKSGDGGVVNTLTNLQKYEYLIAIELGRSFTSLLNVLLVISGAFGIFRKQYFDGLSQFHIDTITEDFDLTLRTRLRGGKIPFARTSIAWTYCPTTWSEWRRQRHRWAHGQIETLIRHKGLLSFKHPKQKWKFWEYFSKDQIAVFDMWAIDIGMNFLFVVYISALFVLVPVMSVVGNIHILLYMVLLVIVTYLISEMVIFTAALILSKEFKKNSGLLKYVPVMALVYRPWLKFIVVNAYIQALRKKKAQW